MDLKGNMIWGCRLISCGSEQGQLGGFCEHGDKHPGSKKDGQFIE